VPIVYVSSLLGHSNLSTTSRYLNINRRGLHLAMQKFEDSRMASNPTEQPPSVTTNAEAVAQPLHKIETRELAVVQHSEAGPSSKPTVQ
jgi:hypothetical protein